MSDRRLRVLTWQVHGNYLYYLSQAPHDFLVVTKARHPPGYAGRVGHLPWGDNVQEVPIECVRDTAFDCVLYQHHDHYRHDRVQVLSDAQRALPALFVEHDPPREHPTDALHPVQDPNMLLVHVTPFNALMWDNGVTPTRVIEHGVLIPDDVAYRGTLPKGVTVVNHLARRGRRLGADVFEAVRRSVPLDLVGMGSAELGGIGEVPNPALPHFLSHYRFFFNPIRYTSLGLAVIEAMTIGLPIIAVATTEMAQLVRSGHNGVADTRPAVLVDAMRALIREPALAQEWGAAARRDALARFGIERFVRDWDAALRDAVG
ncbi:glycosyltransferase [Burkholderia stagnalis]|uniref:Transferase n=1 Tax=Burkholderia stagnalis TaxID=1503054 RepID=A0A119TWH0_9BURK|nr:glycosyltransferase [Burkholderia stagnalis]KVZ11798.1 transferase [Burkholderia stagnalis]KWA55032.1 transferase [Burkholderia stagnalis]KWA56704.1 transferase [Burkholderia stagnalis]KWA56892.1 transferase [Burkholderia stagnalis]KWC94733.1 transferase [Burkholderia stagnalis]